MYDYISITDSQEKMQITFAYSETQKGIRNETYLYEKAYEKYSCTQITTSGESCFKTVTSAEFAWALGEAIGNMITVRCVE